MGVTMRQVAERAGVSIKTVSRVANGEPNVSDELRRRVLLAVEELDWRPSVAARSLRTGRTHSLVVVVPELDSGWAAALTQEIALEAALRGLQVSIEPAGARLQHLASVLRARASSIDGAVVLHPLHGLGRGPRTEGGQVEVGHEEPGAGRFGERPGGSGAGPGPVASVSAVPVSVVRASAAEDLGEGAGGIRLDLRRGAELIASHLRALRLERVALLGPGADVPSGLLGAVGALVPGAMRLPALAGEGMAGGAAAIGALRARLDAIDAIVCADDDLALGALSALAGLGVEVPGRLVVTGLGDLDGGRFSTPSLTTLRFPLGEVARLVLDDLGRAWEVRPRGGARVVEPVLVRRESTVGGMWGTGVRDLGPGVRGLGAGAAPTEPVGRVGVGP